MNFIYLCYKTNKIDFFFTAFLIPYIVYLFYLGDHFEALAWVTVFVWVLRSMVASVYIEILEMDNKALVTILDNIKKKLKESDKK